MKRWKEKSNRGETKEENQNEVANMRVEGYGPDLHNSIATIFFFKFSCLHMGKCFETISELLGSISCC